MERDDALVLANKILERPHGDPDDDLAVLARQLLRAREQVAQLRKTLDATVREREDYNGKHQGACLEIERLRLEVEVLRDYGNKDCTAMADAALEQKRTTGKGPWED